jgi:hypothetical protein
MMRRNYFRVFIVALLASLASCSDENNDPGVTNPVDDRARFTGNWTCSENTGQTFGITISLKGSEDSITINNFSNYGSSANAYGLVSGNSLTIPGQNIGITAVHVQGSGVLNGAGTKITMNYIADGDTISATATKN